MITATGGFTKEHLKTAKTVIVSRENYLDEPCDLRVVILDCPEYGAIKGVICDGFVDDYVSVQKKGDFIWFAPFEVSEIVR